MKSRTGFLLSLLIIALLAFGTTGTGISNAASAAEPAPASAASAHGSVSPTLSSTDGSLPLSSQNFACGGAAIATPRANITTASTPFGIALDNANQGIYVANQSPDVVQEINGSTETILGNSTPIGYNLKSMTYDTANHQMMVVSQGNLGDIPPTVFSLTTGQGVNLKKTAVPIESAYDAYNGNLYVTDYGSAQVAVIDPSDMKLYGYVNVGSHPWGITVDPYNGYVFVANSASNTVSVISGTKVLGTLGSNGTEPIGVLFDPIDEMLYVTNSASNSLDIINASGNTFSNFKAINTLFPSGFNDPEEMGFDCTHNVLWVANDGSNQIDTFLACPAYAFDFGSLQSLQTFNSQAQPQEFTYDNYTHAMYITDYAASNVQVIATDNIMDPLVAGAGCPEGIADIGVNGQQRYSYSTPEVETVTTFSSLSIGSGSNPMWNNLASDQLNVMDYGVAGGIPNNVYWTQTVLRLNQSANCPNTCFEYTDALFNYTKPGTALNTKNGFTTICTKNGGKKYTAVNYFFCDSPWISGLTIPLTVKMMQTTGTETSGKNKGDPYVSFNFWFSDGPDANKWIQWDRIDFNADLSGHHITGDPHFFVSGDPMTTPPFSKAQKCGNSGGGYACPLLNDFENVVIGYGGGNNVVFNSLAAKTQLLYNKSGSLVFVSHAFSAGADTAETDVNAYSLGNMAQSAGIMNATSTEGADDAIQLF